MRRRLRAEGVCAGEVIKVDCMGAGDARGRSRGGGCGACARKFTLRKFILRTCILRCLSKSTPLKRAEK